MKTTLKGKVKVWEAETFQTVRYFRKFTRGTICPPPLPWIGLGKWPWYLKSSQNSSFLGLHFPLLNFLKLSKKKWFYRPLFKLLCRVLLLSRSKKLKQPHTLYLLQVHSNLSLRPLTNETTWKLRMWNFSSLQWVPHWTKPSNWDNLIINTTYSQSPWWS